jgi:hypothetical protein
MGQLDVAQESRACAVDRGFTRKAPAVTVQPAGFFFGVNIAAQGAYASALITP